MAWRSVLEIEIVRTRLLGGETRVVVGSGWSRGLRSNHAWGWRAHSAISLKVVLASLIQHTSRSIATGALTLGSHGAEARERGSEARLDSDSTSKSSIRYTRALGIAKTLGQRCQLSQASKY